MCLDAASQEKRWTLYTDCIYISRKRERERERRRRRKKTSAAKMAAGKQRIERKQERNAPYPSHRPRQRTNHEEEEDDDKMKKKSSRGGGGLIGALRGYVASSFIRFATAIDSANAREKENESDNIATTTATTTTTIGKIGEIAENERSEGGGGSGRGDGDGDNIIDEDQKIENTKKNEGKSGTHLRY